MLRSARALAAQALFASENEGEQPQVSAEEGGAGTAAAEGGGGGGKAGTPDPAAGGAVNAAHDDDDAICATLFSGLVFFLGYVLLCVAVTLTPHGPSTVGCGGCLRQLAPAPRVGCGAGRAAGPRCAQWG